jgi:hypothetical protein
MKMNRNLEICVLLAVAFVVMTNCVTVDTTDSQNVTTLEPKLDETQPTESFNASQVPSDTLKVESRNVDNDEDLNLHVTTVATTTEPHKIPPTLLNAKLDFTRNSSEKPAKSLKDYA